MGVLAVFAKHPHSLWLRRALFQIHLWLGIGIGLYVLIISVSGSLIVFRPELDRVLCPGTLVTIPSGRVVSTVCEPAFVTGMAEFHDHLGIGRAGLLINGLGAIAVIVMCVTGALLWWPGRTRWRRSLVLRRDVSAQRFIWDLHGVLGFWLLLLVLMWALTGLYFAFPSAFNAVPDDAIADLVRLHFGRAYGPLVAALWVILGLVPCALFITGVLMWWYRVWRVRLMKHGGPRREAAPRVITKAVPEARSPLD
jgi:uncharacterized iron-regulated membrane protein